MYPRRWLITFGLLGLLAGALSAVPARLALGVVPWDSLSMPAPRDVSGTIWSGSAILTAHREQVRVTWSASGWALLLATLQADVRFSGRDLEGDGRVRLGPFGREFRVTKATVGPTRLQGLLTNSGISLDKSLQVHGLQLSIADGLIEAAVGAFAWGEGKVRLRSGETVSLPALRGILSTGADGRLHLDVDSERAPGRLLATLDADPGLRELHVAVRQRGFELAGRPVTEPARAPDDVVFEVRQPIR